MTTSTITKPASRQKLNENSIDFAKFIMAFLVVAIHAGTSPLGTFNVHLNFIMVQYVARFAVPFFFISSGYFLFKKIDNLSDIHEQNAIFLRYIMRIAQLYLVWTLIYMPVLLYRNWHALDTQALIRFVRNFFFMGSYFHMWYMPALLFAVILVFLLSKKLDIYVVLVIALVFYVIGVLDETYFALINGTQLINHIHNAYHAVFVTTRNGLFFGFLFVAIGKWFACSKPIFGRNTYALLFVVSAILMAVEIVAILHFKYNAWTDVYFFLFPASFFLFAAVLQTKIGGGLPYVFLRHMSSLVFYSHILFILAYQLLDLPNTRLVCYIVSLLLCLLFSAAVCKLSRIEGLTWLKVLY